MSKDNPAVTVAKESRQATDDVHTLQSGIRVRFKAVSASLIADVTARIKDPNIPVWHNPKKGRDEPNPHDPAYARACEAADRDRGVAAMDAMAMFGVELVDGVPEDSVWIKQLNLLGVEFDADDPVECEFYYKKHIVMDQDAWLLVGTMSGVSEEAVAQAERSFRGN